MQRHLFDALLGAAAVVALPATAAGIAHHAYSASEIAETVAIRTVELEFPAPGEFLVEGTPAASPVATVKVRGFRIMKQQVSAADYSFCVADGACDPADGAGYPGEDMPVTGVSYLDAATFADWYSRRTGYLWRLPTAEEAAAAAGKRFAGDTSSATPDDPANPAVAWLRSYREGAAQKRPADPAVKARGFYGANANGLQDFGGNVWEWTSTCYARTTLMTGGAVESTTENCGVRVLEGRHRAYMSNFVRDGKSGGCAVGTPPEHLGFRLVRDGSLFVRAKLVARRLWTRTTGSWPAIGSQPVTQHSGKD
jgi:formylglycine-generating enzyme required for sulfatase activity